MTGVRPQLLAHPLLESAAAMPTPRDIARRWFEEVWNQRRDAAMAELAAPDTLAHHEWGTAKGLDSFRSHRAQLLCGFAGQNHRRTQNRSA